MSVEKKSLVSTMTENANLMNKSGFVNNASKGNTIFHTPSIRQRCLHFSLNKEVKISELIMKVLLRARGKLDSNWLTFITLEEESYVLKNEKFHGAISSRDRMTLEEKGLLIKCLCIIHALNGTHALNCKKGGFIQMRHDGDQSLETNLLSVVCKDVAIKRRLIPITGDNFIYRLRHLWSLALTASLRKSVKSIISFW